MTVPIDYVRQEIRHLRFGVFHRTLEPHRFHILQTRSIRKRRYWADLWIIGSSHVLNVRTGRAALAEALTCSAGLLPQDSRLDIADADRHGPFEHHIGGEIHYKATLDVVHHSEREFLREHARALNHRSPRRMVYQFPTTDELIRPPVTLIEIVHAEEGFLEIHTFHSYVQDLAIVWTRSEINVGDL